MKAHEISKMPHWLARAEHARIEARELRERRWCRAIDAVCIIVILVSLAFILGGCAGAIAAAFGL